MNQPLITLGSPYGIGYEIFLLSLRKKVFYAEHPVTCIGSESILKHFLKILKFSIGYHSIPADKFERLSLSKQFDKEFVLINIDRFSFDLDNIAQISSEKDGVIAYDTIKTGARLIAEGYFSSMVTLPVSKENINLVDSSFKGHTEFLMKLWNEKKVFMTFISSKMKILLLSTHLPLFKVKEIITPGLVKDGITTAVHLLDDLGEKQRICFLGLNPHAGENGLLGTEELWIKEIIEDFNSTSGCKIVGPVPADTAFTPGNLKNFGIFIASYHDQGLIPFKMLSFEDGVNLSYGMKYIRTSVDHGTARDLIGMKTANTASFENAYRLAVQLSG